MALEFTDANFQKDVMESDKLTVIDFWAEWCARPLCSRSLPPRLQGCVRVRFGSHRVGTDPHRWTWGQS